MLKLGRKVEYGLISLMHMDGLAPGVLASSREIAEAYNIPPDILGKVLQALAREGLIQSIQGVKGGYCLSRPIERIVLGRVIEILDGPVHLAPCACTTYNCDQESTCNIRGSVFHFQDQLNQLVYNLSLASFKDQNVMLQNAGSVYAELDRSL